MLQKTQLLALVAAMATEDRKLFHAPYRAEKIKMILRGEKANLTLEEHLSLLDSQGKYFFHRIVQILEGFE